MKTTILRLEHTNIHAGDYRIHHVVWVREGGSTLERHTFTNRRAAQKQAARLAKSYGCRIEISKSCQGVQYAHEL